MKLTTRRIAQIISILVVQVITLILLQAVRNGLHVESFGSAI